MTRQEWGIGDNVLLIPLALAAIMTYVVTDAEATQEELAQAWNDVLAKAGELGTTVDHIVMLAAPGRWADQGIMEEANALIRAGHAASLCEALQMLLDGVKQLRDKEGKHRKRRIETTQKANNCRHSRHSRA